TAHAPALPGRETHPRLAEPEVHTRLAARDVAASPSATAAPDIPLADAARSPLQPETVARVTAAEVRLSEPAIRPAEPPRGPAPVPAPPPAAEQAIEQPSAATDHFAELAAALQRPSANASEPKPAPMRAGTPAASTADDPTLNDMAH